MKFTASSGDLLKVITRAGAVVPTRSTLPILENYLFDLSGDSLKVTATDLEVSLSSTVRVKGESNGKLAIPAKRLMETVRALPNVEIKFSMDSGTKKLTMKTKTGEYTLAGESSDDYPTIALPKTDNTLALDRETVMRLVNQTVFATSVDELRPAMMGVLFQMRKGEIRTVSTDGHRLVRMNTVAKTSKDERDIVVPSKALNTLAKSLEEENCTIAVDESQAVFTFGETVLVTRLIGEKYPNYESVIPTDNDKKLQVNRNDLLE